MHPSIPALLLLLPLGLSACSLSGGSLDDYYANRKDPTVTTLSVASEKGNLGGGETVISGSGFGSSLTDVIVLFGDENAELLSVTDSEITLLVPRGPITGGAVDVTVATATGNTKSVGAYTYEIGGGLYDDEYGYVQVSNYWESCYGGLSSRLDTEYAEYGGLGCDTFAWIGSSGIEGAASRFDFAYPRIHTNDIGMFLVGASMEGGDTWTVQRPAPFPDTSIVLDDIREDIGGITLRNDTWEGREWCADLDDQAVYYYGGGMNGDSPVSISVSDIPTGTERGNCGDAADAVYQMDELKFCDSVDIDGVRDHVYRPDWPVVANFFAPDRDGGVGDTKVSIDVPEVGIQGVEVKLPGSIIVSAAQGFESPLPDVAEAGDLWSVGSLGGCFDDDGNGERLDDVAVEFTWEPADRNAVSEGAGILGSRTYVRVTITQSGYNWFGLNGFPMRATITVDDKHEVEGGISHLEIPASILYQFPTSGQPASFQNSLANPTNPYGFLVVSVERVTDYVLQTEEGEPIVFSYATGDFGLIDWTNPTDATGCENCLDDDGDGWSDELDPECEGGSTESGVAADTACNNGLDDDGDGDIDAEDANCANGADDDEATCNDAEDNDEDGWLDLADPDCASGNDEVGVGSTGCNNGLDDDADGDIDAEDADCTDAAASEGV